MKTAIKRLLAMVGLAPASQVEHFSDQARRATTRVSDLEERMAKLRADVDAWKRHYEESAKNVAEWKHAASAASAKADQSAVHTKRAEASVQEWKVRAGALKNQLHALRERLDHAGHATAIAREHLMATEAKLDLIEAAIQVLDERTREAAVRS